MIPYGRQCISQADLEAVSRVLESDWLTQGPLVPRFEEELRAINGAKRVVAVCNATAALHLACRAMNLGPGDLLWSPPNTFVASVNCALYCGADVDFVDIDPRTYNLSVGALSDKLKVAERVGRLPKIVVAVHFAGQSCEMKDIKALADKYGFRIIEDASHAIGATYRGARVGGCEYSDVSVFSFHPVKIITTGEGGALLSNDETLAERARLLRSHGISRDPATWRNDSVGQEWYYEQHELGYNYRMTDIQAALGLSQCSRLEEFVARRRAIAKRYDEELAQIGVVIPWQSPEGQSAYHLYPIRIRPVGGRNRRDSVFRSLREQGVGVNVHYIPVHLQPYYRRLGFAEGLCPEAERYYAEAISLPMYFALDDDLQSRVIEAVKKAVA